MSIIEDIMSGLIGVLDAFAHNIIGLGILALIGFFLYIRYAKPKPIDMGQEVKKKQWDATTQRLRLKTKKHLGLCTYPMSVEELRETPIHHIQHDLVGEIVGINVFGIMTDVKTLMKFNENPSSQSYTKLLEENKEFIEADKFWLVFACENVIGTKFIFFPNVKKSLIFVKPSQIINVNSNDNVIRVRGFGLTPQGEYEIINDENINVSRNQLLGDTIQTINEELVLGGWAKMGVVVENAMRSDSEYRKDVAKEGIKVLNVPSNQGEAQQ